MNIETNEDGLMICAGKSEIGLYALLIIAIMGINAFLLLGLAMSFLIPYMGYVIAYVLISLMMGAAAAIPILVLSWVIKKIMGLRK